MIFGLVGRTVLVARFACTKHSARRREAGVLVFNLLPRWCCRCAWSATQILALMLLMDRTWLPEYWWRDEKVREIRY